MKKYATEAQAIAAMNLQIKQDLKRGIIRQYRIMAWFNFKDLVYSFAPCPSSPSSPSSPSTTSSTRKG